MASVRTPDFSSTRDIRKRFLLFKEHSHSTSESSSSQNSDEEMEVHGAGTKNPKQRNERLERDRLRKQVARSKETVEEKVVRLADQHHRSALNRSNETEQQRTERLDNQRHRSALNRSNETEQRRSVRLAEMKQRWKTLRENESEEQKIRRVRSMSARRHQNLMAKKQQTQSQHLNWPSAVPDQLKQRCLQEFIDRMSMDTLRQSTCIVCNARGSFHSMTEYAFKEICSHKELVCHCDLVGVIPGTEDTIHSIGL